MKIEHAFSLAFSAGALLLALDAHRRICRTLSTMENAVRDVSEITPAKVQQSVIDRAVERAVAREAASAARLVTEDVQRKTASEIKAQVKDAVRKSEDELSKAVTDAIAAEAAKIDMKELRKDAMAKAEEQIADKFDGQLDELLEKFNGNLSSVARIYQSIASAMDKKTTGDGNVELRIIGT